MHRFWLVGMLGVGLCSVGCGTSDGGAFGDGSSGGSGGAVSQTELEIVVSASDAPFPHQDQLASQTPKRIRAGVRMLQLEDDQGERFTLFDAQSAATVSYDAGAFTALGRLSPQAIRPGHYVRARLVQDWSSFEIDAALHQDNQAQRGVLSILQITSDGISLDGERYDAGDFVHQFSGPGGQREFSGVLPVPEESHTAGASAFVEDGVWAVYFPMDLTLTAGQVGRIDFRANLDHAFRWTDQDKPGYAQQQYDFAPPLYEVVEQFGANRFDVIVH